MSGAVLKNPPAGAGIGEAGNVSNVCNFNIVQAGDGVKLPSWMSEKLATIAAKINLWNFEQDEITILAAEIRCYPAIASMLPAEFRDKVQTLKPRDLSPLERTAIILAAWNWRNVAHILKDLSTETKVEAKLNAIVYALREGGGL